MRGNAGILHHAIYISPLLMTSHGRLVTNHSLSLKLGFIWSSSQWYECQMLYLQVKTSSQADAGCSSFTKLQLLVFARDKSLQKVCLIYSENISTIMQRQERLFHEIFGGKLITVSKFVYIHIEKILHCHSTRIFVQNVLNLKFCH